MASFTTTPIFNGEGGSFLVGIVNAATDDGIPFNLSIISGAPSDFQARFILVNAQGLVNSVRFSVFNQATQGISWNVDPVNNASKWRQIPAFSQLSFSCTFNSQDIADANNLFVYATDIDFGLSDFTNQYSSIRQITKITEATVFPWTPSGQQFEPQFIYISAANPTAASVSYIVTIGKIDYQVFLAPGAAVNNQVFSGGSTATIFLNQISLQSATGVSMASPPTGTILRISIGCRNTVAT
jgi:hypothetical protein